MQRMPVHCQTALPPYAYVPGQTPRHPEGMFDAIRETARPGMSVHELSACPAWRCGKHYLAKGFFWEAHEVLEALWMALPHNTAERELVQAIIQLANAGLKLRMGREKAAARLLGEASRHAGEADRRGRGQVLGIDPGDLLGVSAGIKADDSEICKIMHKLLDQKISVLRDR